jgi:hypothetical protein
VLAAPAPVPGTDGRTHLVYEIELRNPTARRATLTRAAVLGGARGDRRLATYAGARLVGLLGPSGQPLLPAPVVEPGQSITLYFDLARRPGRRVPAVLRHRLALSLGGDRAVVVRAGVRVSRRPPVRLGPPLRGAGIVGIAAHSAQAIDGPRTHAQRFALDLVQLDETSGTMFAGDPQRNESYAVYGDAALAVAPGRVVTVRSDLPENTPGTEPAFTSWDVLAGNRVVLDLGGGRFALYAHLQPGSVRVRAGDRVARGDVLGRIGNSGLSSAPHLHFHVMDGPGGPSALDANGLPYVFDRFTLTGAIRDLATFELAPAAPPAERARQFPLSGSVVSFP